MAQLLLKSVRAIRGSLLNGAVKAASAQYSSATPGGINKSVFISQSTDIYTNLALEDWLYKNFDFSSHHVMLLWRNDPCVVIGRNQNPWIEVDVEYLNSLGITLARRTSGGGTVYHDKGNLNITFFTPRDKYSRMQNLQLIEKTLRREWCLNIEINEREDLILDNVYKVSGTAARLGDPNAYHHCTLMIDVNKEQLSKALHKKESDRFKTTALKSVKSEVQNLGEAHSEVQTERLMERLGWEYMRTQPLDQADAGWTHVSKQNGFQLVNPTDEWFPGLGELREELTSWKWKFGMTPEFAVVRRVALGPKGEEVGLRLNVLKGIVTPDVSLLLPEGISWGGLSGPEVPLQSTVVGQQYSPALFTMLEAAISKEQGRFSYVQRGVATAP